MNKPHIHAELIKKWADGAEIQHRYPALNTPWEDCPNPIWVDGYEYRVKPEVTTSLSYLDLRRAYYDQSPYPQFAEPPEGTSRWVEQSLRAVADAAIKQYIKDSANKA